MLPLHSDPVWTSEPGRSRPPLDADRDADVVVVGAGLAGLTAAALLAREGLDVVVLEGLDVGSGTTGRTTAKVSALQGLRYSELARQHPADLVRKYALAQQAGLSWIAEQVVGSGDECRWERRTAHTYADGPEQRRAVIDEHRAARSAGLDVELIEDADLPFPTAGAVALADQAQFDPLAYLESLARDVESHGGVIHEQTRVTGVRGAGSGGHSVVSGRASVRAPNVVVATLLPILDRGLFFARAEPSASYTIAVDVDGDLPPGQYLSAGSPTRSLRTAWHRDREVLVVGGGGHVVGRKTPTLPQFQELASWAADRFAVNEVVARWFAHDYRTVDHLPWAGPASPFTPNVSVAGGFGKWGMTNATAAALVIADRVLRRTDGPSSPWADAFDPGHISRRAIGPLATLNGAVAAHLLGGWLHPDAAPTGPDDDGRTRRSGIFPVGQAHDDDGEIDQVAVVCTHLGGICTWNDAERTWDCPLHGSRFATDGTVVTGPATRPLHRGTPN